MLFFLRFLWSWILGQVGQAHMWELNAIILSWSQYIGVHTGQHMSLFSHHGMNNNCTYGHQNLFPLQSVHCLAWAGLGFLQVGIWATAFPLPKCQSIEDQLIIPSWRVTSRVIANHNCRTELKAVCGAPAFLLQAYAECQENFILHFYEQRKEHFVNIMNVGGQKANGNTHTCV